MNNEDNIQYKEAYLEWSDKTDFIQEWMDKGKIPIKYL